MKDVNIREVNGGWIVEILEGTWVFTSLNKAFTFAKNYMSSEESSLD